MSRVAAPHQVFITVDVDWAPDWAMKRLLDALVDAGAKSTWFITHESDMLDELRAQSELVELGIHPNFQRGSTHGDDPSSVLAECMRIVPEARVMRAHCLMQSTPILQSVVDETPIVLDCSIYLRDAVVVRASELPLDRGRKIARLPYVWEDDLEFFADQPRWDAGAFVASRDRSAEITVVDVHPIHYVLNSAQVGPYNALKQAVGNTLFATEGDAAPFEHEQVGTATFIDALVRTAARIDLGGPLSALARPTAGTPPLH